MQEPNLHAVQLNSKSPTNKQVTIQIISIWVQTFGNHSELDWLKAVEKRPSCSLNYPTTQDNGTSRVQVPKFCPVDQMEWSKLCPFQRILKSIGSSIEAFGRNLDIFSAASSRARTTAAVTAPEFTVFWLIVGHVSRDLVDCRGSDNILVFPSKYQHGHLKILRWPSPRHAGHPNYLGRKPTYGTCYAMLYCTWYYAILYRICY